MCRFSFFCFLLFGQLHSIASILSGSKPLNVLLKSQIHTRPHLSCTRLHAKRRIILSKRERKGDENVIIKNDPLESEQTSIPSSPSLPTSETSRLVRQDDVRIAIKRGGGEDVDASSVSSFDTDSDGTPLSSSISPSGIGKFSSLQRDMDLAMQAVALREMELKKQQQQDSSSSNTKDSIINKAKDALGVIFIVDFFVIMFFLGWFLIAAALQSSNPWFLERFQDIFQPVVVPSLTVLMTLSIASGVLNRNDKDNNDNK